MDEDGQQATGVGVRRRRPSLRQRLTAAGLVELSVARQSKSRCQRQSAAQSMVALRWAGSAAVKSVAAIGGGLKGQALRASAQPGYWEADAT